jgi:hypothetical protein
MRGYTSNLELRNAGASLGACRRTCSVSHALPIDCISERINDNGPNHEYRRDVEAIAP